MREGRGYYFNYNDIMMGYVFHILTTKYL